MEQMNDGGPAFPGEQGHTPEHGWNQTWERGMSLRDYFAAHALQAIIAKHPAIEVRDESDDAEYAAQTTAH